MVSSAATTVAAYLDELPPERRAVVAALRKVIRAHLPKGYAERMNWGMISYEIPLSRYPDTYNGQPLAYAAIAAQKNNYAVYLMGAYGDAAVDRWFRAAWTQAGKKLDMGKSCVRFKRLEDVPLDVLGAMIAKVSVDDYLAAYEKVKPPKAATRKRTAGKVAKKGRA